MTGVPDADPLRHLREAVRLAPANIPLRQHLAEFLLKSGQADEAEKEYRDALALAPESADLKLGLARAFHQQGKDKEALVIVESLVNQPKTAGAAFVLHARLLFRAGDVEQAVRQYRRGVDEDPSVADPDLAGRLGIGSEAGSGAEVVEGRLRAAREDLASAAAHVERPRITFKDVGGMEGVKEEIRMKIIQPMLHPELFRAYGKKIGGGILTFGPPGCGKTHLARSTAGEVKANFIAVGISDVLDMWIGNSERNLHELFEQARRNRPCVLFFDEVDALGASRSDMRASAGRHLINQFLSEFDGLGADNEGILILAATNAPWHVDPAFRRPGRFDQVLFVPPPDRDARAEILRIQLRGKPVDDIDHAQVASRTEGCSGADLKAVVDRAVEAKLREAIKAGKPQPIGTKDLLHAAKAVKPSTAEWFATARNYALYSNQGGVYDDVLRYLKLR
jgi:SpoVK/Ycf46/Vps4 family AAA+-type ATPase